MSPMILETDEYEHIIVSGTPYERGFQHGSQARSKVQYNVNRYRSSPGLPPPSLCTRYIREIYLPALLAHFPIGLEEMRGLAAGADVSLEDVILCNARYDLSRVQLALQSQAQLKNILEAQPDVGECTSMALVHEHDDEENKSTVYVAQNWDIAPWLCESNGVIVLHIQNPEGDDISTPKSIICLTEAGQLGRSGMNSMGLALCANSLWSNEDSAPLTPSSPATTKSNPQTPYLPFSLARRMFLECGTIAAGLQVLATFPRHVSGNIIAGDRSGIAIDLELSPSSTFKLLPKGLPQQATFDNCTKLLTHANSFVSPAMLARSDIKDTYPGGSSFFRGERLAEVLERRARKGSANGGPRTLGIKDVRLALADHGGFPRSLCEHRVPSKEMYGAAKGESVTVAGVIYDLDKGEMHICKGNPCEGRWVVHRL